MKIYGVWYYGVIVRGPFVSKKLAKAAIQGVKKTCNCDYASLKIAEYDQAADAQGCGYTHPSVLALLAGKLKITGVAAQ